MGIYVKKKNINLNLTIYLKKKISKWNMYLPIKNKTKNFWKKIFVTLARSPTLCLGESGLSASVSR